MPRPISIAKQVTSIKLVLDTINNDEIVNMVTPIPIMRGCPNLSLSVPDGNCADA